MSLKKGTKNISLLKKIPVNLAEKNIIDNGIYKASDDGFDGYSEVNVNVGVIFTGSYDAEGLKTIGWSDEEIAYYNKHGVQWNESENDSFKLTDKELAGDDSSNTRFLPKNSTKTSFSYYYNLLAIPLINTSTKTNISSMFIYCYSLTTIPLLDTSEVTDMNSMFKSCYSLTTIPQLDTSKVTNMNGVFFNCYSLTTIPLLNTSKVTDMSSMFVYCYSLTTIPLLDTSEVKTMNSMFSNCYSLKTIPQLDTSKVTNMSSMFLNCESLKTIPLLNTSKVTDMSFMFRSCYSLTTIPQLDTSKVTNMSYFAANCLALKEVPQLKANNIITVRYPLYYSDDIINFGGFLNLGQAYLTTQSANYSDYTLDISTSTALTEQSLINTLTNVYDIKTKGCNIQSIVLGKTNLAKLTSEEGQAALTQATTYGWSVS